MILSMQKESARELKVKEEEIGRMEKTAFHSAGQPKNNH